MIQVRLQYILFFALGINLLFGGNMAFSFGQSNFKFDDINLKTNSLKLSEPIYQAITGKFLAAKDLSSTPFKVAEESFLHHILPVKGMQIGAWANTEPSDFPRQCRRSLRSARHLAAHRRDDNLPGGRSIFR